MREIGVFFANLCVSGRSYGQTAQFGTAFPCQIRTFCQRAGVFFPPSNRIGPNQQSKRCGEPIAFPIRVERRNHGLFPLSRTRKESFLPSGPGRRNSVLCFSDVRGGEAPLAGRAVCSRVERAWGSSAVHLGEVCAVPFASGRVAFHGRRAFRGSNLALGFASSAVLAAG